MNFRQILDDAGASAARKFIGILTGVLVIPVITRWLGEGSYGIWTTVLATVSLFATVSGLHLHGALIRYINEQSEEQTFTDILSLTTFIGIIVSVSLVTAGIVYNRYIGFESKVLGNLLFPASLLVGGRLFDSILSNYLRAQQRLKSFEVLRTAKKLVETAVIIAALWLTRDLVVAIWSLVLVTAIIDSILLIILLPNRLIRPKIDNFQNYLRYGIPMVPKEVAGSLLHHADKFLILFFLDPAAAGIYAVAYRVSQLLASTFSIFSSTLYPRVTAAWDNNEMEQLSAFYNIFLRWYCILLVPAIAGLRLLADSILRFISTSVVATQGITLIPVLAIGFGMQGLEFTLSYPLAAAERTRKIALITSVAVILNIILNIVLIPEIGIFGAAVATTLSFGLRTGWLYYNVSKLINFKLPTPGLIKSGISTSAMTAVLYIIPVTKGLVQLIVYPILGAFIFVIIFLLINGPTEQELNKASELINKTLL